MRKIIIIDAMSYLRVKMETEGPQFLRGVLNETLMPDLRIWVWDGAGGNKARRAIFPAYKTSREYQPGVIVAMDFVRELLALTPSWQIRVPGFEGDDVIAHLVQHFLDTTDLPIEIRCRDGDLTALCALSSHVTCTHEMKGIAPEHIRLYKLWVGDPADDIPGVKGFGKGAWEKADKRQLQVLTDWLLAGDFAADLAEGLMSKASFNWLMVPENREQFKLMAQIIDPLPIDPDVINEHMIMGNNDPAALEVKMREYLL